MDYKYYKFRINFNKFLIFLSKIIIYIHIYMIIFVPMSGDLFHYGHVQ